MSGLLAYGIFQVTRRLILDHEQPIERVKRLGPFFFGWVFFILGLVTLFKGLKNLKLDLDLSEALLGSAALAVIGGLLMVFAYGQVRGQVGVWRERDRAHDAEIKAARAEGKAEATTTVVHDDRPTRPA